MSETMRMWTEVAFNIAYLVVIWGLVITMLYRRAEVEPSDWPIARLFIGAFALLAVGDTGHVGFRVLAYARGSLESSITVLGTELGLVGLGALATATTVTAFYALILAIWRSRFGKPYGLFGYFLLLAAIVRIVIMIPAANEWNNVVPPHPWSLYRNVPLMIQGLGVAFLILRDAAANNDRAFRRIGYMILASYAFYTPVILVVRQTPAVGMLMIPKQLDYVAIAIIGYRSLYPPKGSAVEASSPQRATYR